MGLRVPAYLWIIGLAILLTPLVRCEEELQHSHIQGSYDENYDSDYTDDSLENDVEEAEVYNHLAVIGSKREAKQFHSLTVDEAKQRLAEIIRQIDFNGDEIINYIELLQYIKHNLQKLDVETAEIDFNLLDADNTKSLSWDEYVLYQYGYSVQQIQEFANETDENTLQFLEMVGEDRARWTAANVNKDDELDLVEFAAFLAPFNYEHMQNYEVDRVLNMFDDSADGSISLNEFVAHETGTYNDDVNERFAALDKNADGNLERSEIRDWVAPGLETSAELETRQLLRSTNPDADELTFSEILDHHEIWVGSQAHSNAEEAYANAQAQSEELASQTEFKEAESDTETKSAQANFDSAVISDSEDEKKSRHSEL